MHFVSLFDIMAQLNIFEDDGWNCFFSPVLNYLLNVGMTIDTLRTSKSR